MPRKMTTLVLVLCFSLIFWTQSCKTAETPQAGRYLVLLDTVKPLIFEGEIRILDTATGKIYSVLRSSVFESVSFRVIDPLNGSIDVQQAKSEDIPETGGR